QKYILYKEKKKVLNTKDKPKKRVFQIKFNGNFLSEIIFIFEFLENECNLRNVFLEALSLLFWRKYYRNNFKLIYTFQIKENNEFARLYYVENCSKSQTLY
ncbi:hypothetical protein IMG5_149780, partial [Ichthyophthirius multifiliis]